MSDIQSVIDSTVEQWLEDEQWRANLNDAEARLLLDWAIAQLNRCTADLADDAAPDAVRATARQLRKTLRAINALLEADRLPTPAEAGAALEAALGAAAPANPSEPLPDRLALLRWLTA